MSALLSITEARAICERFALKHKIVFDDAGHCGFGRDCVGFRHGSTWIDHNPLRFPDYEYIEELRCQASREPSDVNAYHKHDCLAVLGHDEEAITGLARWVLSLEAAGEVRIVEYKTGATGLQALISGTTGRAVIVTPSA